MDTLAIIQKHKEKKDPNLALFRAVSEMQAKIDQEIKDAMGVLEDKLQAQVQAAVRAYGEELKASYKPVDFQEILKSVRGQTGEQGEKGEKGDKGDMPVAGVDFELPKDGQDYVLTETDKKEIAAAITVPVVEKVIEKIEVVKEQPIITHEIKEVAKFETPEQIAEKLNTLEAAVDMKVIKGLTNWLHNLKKSFKEKGGSGGGGMGNPQHESFSVSSATTYIETASNIAASGYAVWAYYNGQFIARGVGYTSSGRRRLNLLFTPDDNSSIDLIYFRA